MTSYSMHRRTWLNARQTQIAEAARLLRNTASLQGTIYVMGCGGSNAQAQHLVGELVGGMTTKSGPAFRAQTIPEIATLTATANDEGWLNAFARPLRAATKCDALVVLTTSGKSPVVLEAVNAASKIGMPVIAITGSGGLQAACTLNLTTDSAATAEVQEQTLTLIHALVELMETMP